MGGRWDGLPEAPFTGDWHGIGDRNYACYVAPASLPTWVPVWMDGPVGVLFALFVVRRLARPPWAVVVYRARPRFNVRFPVMFREEFPTLGEANARAREIDRDLRRGHRGEPRA